MTGECYVFLFPTILILRYSMVYVCTLNCSNIISDLGEALIILGFDVKTTSLKMCVNCKTFSTMLEKIKSLSELTTSMFLMYFSIILRSKEDATLLVVMVRPL